VTWPTRGTVYGTLLNFPGELAALGGQVNQPPYKAPPRAPVLYIKPANTWSADGAEIPLPADVPHVEVGATVGMVMKAHGEVAGYVLMNDLSVPHDSLFRPPVKFNCLDGFLGVGGITAGGAKDNLVLAGFSNNHKLLGVLAADSAAVGLNDNYRQSAP